jgi:hypothetical protein
MHRATTDKAAMNNGDLQLIIPNNQESKTPTADYRRPERGILEAFLKPLTSN